MTHIPVTALIVVLFLLVGCLLTYGARTFRDERRDPAGERVPAARVNMRREVLWTAMATVLLLLVFLFVR